MFIKARNTPQEAILPTLQFTSIEEGNKFSVSIFEKNVKLETAAVYYPSMFGEQYFDEYIQQPDYIFYPYHLDLFLKGLYEKLPMNPELVMFGQGGNFPIIIVPNYVVNGYIESFVGLYMVDYSWSRTKENTGFHYEGVRLLETFQNADEGVVALDKVAKEALRLLVENELKGYAGTVDVSEDQVLIAIKGEPYTITLDEILADK